MKEVVMISRPYASLKMTAAMTVVILLLQSITSMAQTSSGNIVGRIYDTKKSPIPEALVMVTNNDTGITTATVAGSNGVYTVPNVIPGSYKILARKKGYVDQPIKNFPVEINKNNVVRAPDITLRLVTLTGKVVDRASNPLINARVVVTSEGEGFTRTALTNQYGNYKVADLPVGNYIIKALRTGSAEQPDQSFLLSLNQRNEYAPTIKLINATSDAQAPAPQQPASAPPLEGEEVSALVQTVDAARSSNFDERQIHALPSGGSTYMRSFDEFALLAPGVAPPPYTPGARGPGVGYGIGTAGEFSVNGMRARSNNFSVDGSDNNDADVGVRRQGFVALVPQSIESAKDFSIATLLWNAELGRNFGSQVNAVSKYGANRFYGQVYVFFTDSRLNARNFFDYTGGPSIGKDPFTHTQAGFAIGGPIARNRTHFFGSYEHQQINASTEQHFSTPTIAERSFPGPDKLKSVIPGGVSEFGALVSGQIASFQNTTPLGRNILSFYPLPNNAGGPFGANTYTEVLPADGRGDALSFKITHQIAPSHLVNARYNFTDDNRILPSVGRAIRSTLESRTQSHNFSLIVDDAMGPRLFNQARFSFGRTRLNFLDYAGSPFIFSATSEESVSTDGGVISATSKTGPIGELLIEPFSPVGANTSYFPQSRASTTFQFADSVSWLAGNHSMKFGGNIRRYQLNSLLDRLYRPQVVFAGGVTGNVRLRTSEPTKPSLRGFVFPLSGAQLASLGVPSSITQTITSGLPDSNIGLRFTEYHLFFNDYWRIRPNLTLDYGLRYEYNTVPREVNNRIENAIQLKGLPSPGQSRFDSPARTDAFNASVNAYKKILDGRTRIYDPDGNNFGPHVGIAWSPGSDEKTAIRAGYGIYHDAILGAIISQSRNVFPNEIPINVDPSFLVFDPLNLNNPVFLAITQLPPKPDEPPIFTNPLFLLKPGTCNQFGTCNQLGGTEQDFVALMGQLFSQNLGGGLAFTLTEKKLRTPYAQQWHLTIEREMFGDYLFSAAYVGTKGTKLTRLTTPNGGPNVLPFVSLVTSVDANNLNVPLVFNPLVGSGLVSRLNKNLGPYQIYENSACSTYHALQLEARKRYSFNFQLTAAYTWSHAIDDVSDVFPLGGAPILAQDSGSEHGDASFDIRHRFAVSFIWDVPFRRDSSSRLGLLIGGWQIASIFQANMGQPFTLNLPVDANLDGNLTDRPINVPGSLIFFQGHGPRRVALAPGFSAESLTRPMSIFVSFPPERADGFGPIFMVPQRPLIGRNTARGDSFINLDLSINKTFRLNENRTVEFRTEFFNLFNRANFGLPVRVLGAPGFGSSVDTITPARTIRFALKYSF